MDIRFERNIGALSLQEQRRLFEKSVCIIGCGGIGSRTAELLLRAGIGSFTLIDNGRFNPSDYNRHPLYRPALDGRFKVTALRRALLGIEPTCRIETVRKPCEISPLPPCDLYIDATDSKAAHRHLAQAAPMPLLHAQAFGYIAKIVVSTPASKLLSDLYPDLRPVLYPAGRLGAMDAFCAAMLCIKATQILSSESGKPVEAGISEYRLI
ncbi:MAG: ThiF family adenylyltransferase [Clostridia bacterium]|nr:ThiF family adenylyltransferase [Clostridia bacterium]